MQAPGSVLRRFLQPTDEGFQGVQTVKLKDHWLRGSKILVERVRSVCFGIRFQKISAPVVDGEKLCLGNVDAASCEVPLFRVRRFVEPNHREFPRFAVQRQIVLIKLITGDSQHVADLYRNDGVVRIAAEPCWNDTDRSATGKLCFGRQAPFCQALILQVQPQEFRFIHADDFSIAQEH
ncbi:MAG: hypothetical protein IKS55_09150 [Oscillospiraceae bacterium]|nr:hypothetical protein [Oscillospiraceae bacterium]